MNIFLAFPFLLLVVFIFPLFSSFLVILFIAILAVIWSHSWGHAVNTVNAEVIFTDDAAREQGGRERPGNYTLDNLQQ